MKKKGRNTITNPKEMTRCLPFEVKVTSRLVLLLRAMDLWF